MDRIDLIALNGGDGEHYEWQVRGVAHKINPNGLYALYKKSNGAWSESASVTNNDLIDGKFAPKHQKTSAIDRRIAVVGSETEFTRNRSKND